MSEKRAYTRHEYRAHATLHTESSQYAAHIINVSYTGALIAILGEHDITADDSISLTLETEGNTMIIMTGKIAHTKEHFLGLKCKPEGEEDTRNLAELLIATTHVD